MLKLHGSWRARLRLLDLGENDAAIWLAAGAVVDSTFIAVPVVARPKLR